jgi:hypothetical protein
VQGEESRDGQHTELSTDEKERTSRDVPVGGGEKGLDGQSRKSAHRGCNEGRGETTKTRGGERMSFGGRKGGAAHSQRFSLAPPAKPPGGSGAAREGRTDTHDQACKVVCLMCDISSFACLCCLSFVSLKR